MSGYILCRVPRAGEPYFLESISTNIYSIEELCYFFRNNLPLIDESVLNETLYRWLRDELGLGGLYQRLHAASGRKTPDMWGAVHAIFKEINYLSHEEQKEFDKQAALLDGNPPHLRLKLKGDSLVENGIYVNALKVYQKLLSLYQDDETVGDVFLGSVFHNEGCAYSYLFQMEEALECFERAYELLHTGKALRSYLYAFYMAKTPIEYMSRLAELGVDEQTKREVAETIAKVTNSDQPAIQDHQMDGMLETMMRNYHRSTGA